MPNMGFYSFASFPIPSVWVAASGCDFGYIAIAKKPNEDVTVEEIVAGKRTGVIREIDYYKIQYRYKEPIWRGGGFHGLRLALSHICYVIKRRVKSGLR